jgi:hypothetical protein
MPKTTNVMLHTTGSYRVEIPPYTDRWMMGDRCGEVIRTYNLEANGRIYAMCRVKLDISGKLTSVIEDDCRII